MYPLIIFDNRFNIYTKCPLHGTLANTNTHMLDARECINSIAHGLFAVIKAIISNQNDLNLIMNYIQRIVSINENINKIK